MGRPAICPATKRAIVEAVVEFVHRSGRATPQEVVNALARTPGPWYRIKLTPHRLGKILRGEDRIERRYGRGHRSYYALAGYKRTTTKEFLQELEKWVGP